MPPPAGISETELTDIGLQLEPGIMGLGRWGVLLISQGEWYATSTESERESMPTIAE